MTDGNQILVAGIGSDFGDDRLGWIVVERLAMSSRDCVVRTLRKPVDLLDYLPGVDVLHLIDASRGAAAIGMIQRFEWPFDLHGSFHFGGTHDFGLISALKLAESLGTLPSRVTIWGIAAAPASGDPTNGLSPAVAKGVDMLVERLGRELEDSEAADRSVEQHA